MKRNCGYPGEIFTLAHPNVTDANNEKRKFISNKVHIFILVAIMTRHLGHL
jgi:hypothetical protein